MIVLRLAAASIATLAALVGKPLWCHIAGHGEPLGPTNVNGILLWCCRRCGAWWPT